MYKIRGQRLILQLALLLTQNRETQLCKGKVLFHNVVMLRTFINFKANRGYTASNDFETMKNSKLHDY